MIIIYQYMHGCVESVNVVIGPVQTLLSMSVLEYDGGAHMSCMDIQSKPVWLQL